MGRFALVGDLLPSQKPERDDFLLAADLKCSEYGFMSFDTDQVEDAACDMPTNAAIRVGKLCGLILAGGREFQHIQRAVIFHSDLFPFAPLYALPSITRQFVKSIVSAIRSHSLKGYFALK